MTTEEIKSSLCAYDIRNPNVRIDFDTGEPMAKPEKCSCDDCFYSRAPMAEYMLTLLDQNTELLEALIAAKEHLEYCGYGDAWEREVARASGLEERIEKAITNATKYGNS